MNEKIKPVLNLAEKFREMYNYTVLINLFTKCCCLQGGVLETRESATWKILCLHGTYIS